MMILRLAQYEVFEGRSDDDGDKGIVEVLEYKRESLNLQWFTDRVICDIVESLEENYCTHEPHLGFFSLEEFECSKECENLAKTFVKKMIEEVMDHPGCGWKMVPTGKKFKYECFVAKDDCVECRR